MVSSTGTFVSCKDYDDDIDNLQEQIDKLATKEDMQSQLSQMQSAVEAAKTAAAEALKAAEAADNSAKVAELTRKVEALEDASINVDALLAKVQEAVDQAIDDAKLDDLKAEIAEQLKVVQELTGYAISSVTSVELVYSYVNQTTDAKKDEGIDVAPYAGQALDFTTIVEKENTFGKNLTGAMSFVKDRQVQVPATFIVRVAPTNAVLDASMISLQNGKGEKLSIVNIEKADAYNELLTRAASTSGLWKITAQLSQYDKNVFLAAQYKNGKSTDGTILYAVAVNNTPKAENVREVVSTYDLTLDHSDYTAENVLNFFVNDTNIKNINNRYDDSSKSLDKPAAAAKNLAPELAWKDKAAVAATDLNNDGTPKATSNARLDASSDNRSDKDVYPAVQGEEITISLAANELDEFKNYKAPATIKGMYITLDHEANAIESSPSEWNAWNSYQYTGLNTVVTGTSTKITINPGANQKIINDIVGFRVYAVNWDGTLVDPDGKAFYVKLGEAGADWNAVNTTIVPENINITPVTQAKSNSVAVTLTKLTGATAATWTTDKVDGTAPAFNAYFVDKDNKVIYNTSNANQLSVDFSKVTKIYTMPVVDDWTKYEDDKTYNGTLTISNADKFVLATIKVSMTKVLPTGLPDGFSVKTNQVIGEIYNCYLVPKVNANDANATWTAKEANWGTMKMTDVFNFGKDNTSSQAHAKNYIVTFAESDKKDNKLIAVTPAGNGTLTVAKSYIDNKTKHATSVDYNYGQISSKKVDGEYVDYTINATTFQTIYNCVYNGTYSWRWATREDLGGEYIKKDDKGNYTKSMPYTTTLTYGTNSYANNNPATVPTIDVYAQYIQGLSSRDGLYSAKLSEPYGNSLKIKEAHLVSDANKQVDEYFTVEYVKDGNMIKGFTAAKVTDTTNPEKPVASTLVITVYDMYGHEFDITIPMTVNKR